MGSALIAPHHGALSTSIAGHFSTGTACFRPSRRFRRGARAVLASGQPRMSLSSSYGSGFRTSGGGAHFPSGGVRQANGTMTWYGDFQLLDWPELRFKDNTWGRGPVADGEQCIVAREGDDGLEFGWRRNWPELPDDNIHLRYEIKGFPNVRCGQHPWQTNSRPPYAPVRIVDISRASVSSDVGLETWDLYNPAFDLFLTSDHPPTGWDNVTTEIMV